MPPRECPRTEGPVPTQRLVPAQIGSNAWEARDAVLPLAAYNLPEHAVVALDGRDSQASMRAGHHRCSIIGTAGDAFLGSDPFLINIDAN